MKKELVNERKNERKRRKKKNEWMYVWVNEWERERKIKDEQMGEERRGEESIPTPVLSAF